MAHRWLRLAVRFGYVGFFGGGGGGWTSLKLAMSNEGERRIERNCIEFWRVVCKFVRTRT